mgnify:CR=1 FL=1
MTPENLSSVLSFIRVGGLLTSLVLLGGTWLVARLLTQGAQQLGNRFTEHRLLLSQVASFTRFGVYFFGILLAFLSAVELRQETVLALSGSAGVALGFAFKDLASSVLAGVTILIDKPFQVGDRVSAGGVYGDVVSIGLRSVRIVTLDDNLVTLPNHKFLTEAVSSGNAGELNMLVQMDFFIGADQDVDEAVRILEEALSSSRFTFLSKPWTVLVKQVQLGDHFAIRLRGKAYVVDTGFEKAFESDVHRTVLRAFRQRRILPPGRRVHATDDVDITPTLHAV